MKKVISLIMLLAFGMFCVGPVAADEVSELKAQLQDMQSDMRRLMSRIETLEREKSRRMETPQDVADRVSSLERKLDSSTLSKLSSDTLKIGGFIQSYYKWAEESSGTDTFDVRRARLGLSGSIASDWSYKFVVDFTASGGNLIRDAKLAYKPLDWMRLTFGQQKIPFSYEKNTSAKKLDAIVSPQVTSNLTTDRDIGLMADGKVLDDKIYYAVGVFNGTGKNSSDNNETKDVITRVLVSPFKDSYDEWLSGLTFGGSYQYGRQPESGTNVGERERIGGTMVYKYDRFKMVGEYIYQELEQTDATYKYSDGWYVTTTYNVWDDLKAVARYEQYDPDRDADNDRNDIVTVGGRYTVNKYIAVDSNYRMKLEEGTDTDNNEFIIQTQVKF
jgi:hypothetical protein